jgi:hypothetical protein
MHVILRAPMALCRHRAVLIITQDVSDTSTSVARDRLPLFCDLKLGHDGPHQDLARHESWEGVAGRQATILRHAADSDSTTSLVNSERPAVEAASPDEPGLGDTRSK